MTLRQPIRHLHSLTTSELNSIAAYTKSGRIEGPVTEKTDGMAFEVGYDALGFFTRTSRSAKMRNPGDYVTDAYKRFGAKIDPAISHGFADIHFKILDDMRLREYLQDTQLPISGEIFYPKFAKPAAEHMIQFVGTAYDRRIIGDGMFILHSQCNKPDIPFRQFGFHFRWDTDEVLPLYAIDPSIFIMANDVMEPMSVIYDQLLNRLKPKWGPEAEGYVIHPTDAMIPKLKVIHPEWKKRKERINYGKEK